MAIKKTVAKAPSKAKAGKKPKAARVTKKVAKRAVKTAKTLLGKIAQRSAQLILDSGLLGEPPKPSGKRAATKKRPRKA